MARFGLPLLGMPTHDQPLSLAMVPEALVTMVLPEELPETALTIDFTLDEGRYAMTIEAEAAAGQRRNATDRISVEDGGIDSSSVQVEGSLAALLWIRRGDMTAREALTQELVSVSGPSDNVAAARRMLGFERTLSPPARQG